MAVPIFVWTAISSAATPPQTKASGQLSGLADLTIEQLMDVQVTSVSKKGTILSHSPAAIAVITAEDIRRLGITNIPEALRLAPGVEVARITAHQWAVSDRGFNGQFSDKLLVLLDGRTIYAAAFPGVNWDVQDILLEDIDRIEVIRGPGAALWGSNAVNGVINIITKSASRSQGRWSRQPPPVGIDAGVIWRPSRAVEAGLWGRNLMDSRHP